MHPVVLPGKATNGIHRDAYVPDFHLSPQKHLGPGHQACKPDLSGHLGTEKESRLLFNFKDQSLTLSACKQIFLSI